MKKTLKIALALFSVAVVFILGMLASNYGMKFYVGHGREVIVPNIVSKNFNVARKKCKKLELYVQSIEEKHSATVKKGNIISQSPLPNTKIKKSRTIDVIVSKGPEIISIPPIDNLSVPAAKLRLKNAGIVPGKMTSRYSNIIKKGRVISHKPVSLTTIAKGQKLDYIISLGKVNQNNESSKYLKLLEQQSVPDTTKTDSTAANE